MPAQGFDKLQRKLSRLRNALAVKAPKVVAAEAERFYKESFRNQGFTDAGLRKWQKTKGGKTGRILKKTGLLFNSIRVDRADINVIRVVAGGPHVPYAKIHNEGGTIEGTATVRAHRRRGGSVKTKRGRVVRKDSMVQAHTRKMLVYMAKRQFMGRSQQLEVRMRAKVIAVIAEAIKD